MEYGVQTPVAGGWVKIRDPRLVPERLRRPVQIAQARIVKYDLEDLDLDPSTPTTADEAKAVLDQIGEDGLTVFSDLNDLVVLAMVEEWSFGPVTKDTLLDLPGSTYDEVRAMVAPLWVRGNPDFSPSPDPASPTGPSSD